jgi:hypothetical protein
MARKKKHTLVLSTRQSTANYHLTPESMTLCLQLTDRVL